MGLIKVKTFSPLIFQSKFFCLSFFYLVTTLPISIYVSLSKDQPNKCLFLSLPPNLPKSNDLFTYPLSYGEHKYALTSTQSDCTSPIHFSDYKIVFDEMQDLCKNLTMQKQDSPDLRYMNGTKDGSFSGNFSTQIRKSFFDYINVTKKEVPCGLVKNLPIKKHDKLAMEKCNGLVVVSAVFINHDKIRQPRGIGSKTLESVCFFMFIDNLTLKTLILHQILQDEPTQIQQIGIWRIISLPTNKMPYENAVMNAVIFKYLIHRLFPNSKFSIWIDAKLQLTVDPVLLVHSLLVKENADMALSKHPINVHTMEEAIATVRWKKWRDVEAIRVQMESYCEYGLEPWSQRKLPYTTDVPDTALIIRRHGVPSNLFSCLLFNELEAFNPRDQLAFAFVRDFINPKININMFNVDVFEHIAIEYRHNLQSGNLQKEGWGEDFIVRSLGGRSKKKMGSLRDVRGSSCEIYLLKMWGEYVDD